VRAVALDLPVTARNTYMPADLYDMSTRQASKWIAGSLAVSSARLVLLPGAQTLACLYRGRRLDPPLLVTRPDFLYYLPSLFWWDG
jgi:hypothetical protein